MSIKHLDERELIQYMGWNSPSVAGILRDFISLHDLDDQLLPYRQQRALAEGETLDDEDE